MVCVVVVLAVIVRLVGMLRLVSVIKQILIRMSVNVIPVVSKRPCKVGMNSDSVVVVNMPSVNMGIVAVIVVVGVGVIGVRV